MKNMPTFQPNYGQSNGECETGDLLRIHFSSFPILQRFATHFVEHLACILTLLYCFTNMWILTNSIVCMYNIKFHLSWVHTLTACSWNMNLGINRICKCVVCTKNNDPSLKVFTKEKFDISTNLIIRGQTLPTEQKSLWWRLNDEIKSQQINKYFNIILSLSDVMNPLRCGYVLLRFSP